MQAQGPSTRRLWLVLWLFGVLCGTAWTTAVGPAHAQSGESVTWRLVEHPLDVRPDDVARLVLEVRGDVPDRATVVVRVFEPVVSRDRLPTALAGDTGPTQDRITVNWADLTRAGDGSIELLVPTTSGPLQRGVLRLPAAGVYPVRLELRAPPSRGTDGAVLAQLVTLFHAVTDETESSNLDIAYLATVTSPPARQVDGAVIVDPRARRMLDDVADMAEATDVPFSVALPPELIEALSVGSDDDRALWQRLADGLADDDVLASPAVTLDPSTAVRSGLSDTYTTLLRRGEDAVVAMVGRGNVERSLQVIGGDIDVGGAVLLRDLGARSVVLTPDAQTALGLGVGDTALADPTLMVALPLGGNSELPAAWVDPALARHLTRAMVDVEQQVFEFIAELLVMRYELVDRAGDEGDGSRANAVLSRRSLVLSTPDGSPAPPELLATLLSRIDGTPGLRVVTASQASATTGVAIANGLTVTVDLPDAAGRDLTERAEDLFVLSLDAFTVASMLPEGDGRPLSWGDQLWRLVALELDDREVERGLDHVRGLLDEVRNAVRVASANDVTLGGRVSVIRLKLRNDADFDVRVAVRLESAKLAFPEGQQLVDLPASTTLDVEIPVEVRSNGRFPVSVTLLTPEGDVPLGTPVEFAARATALTGLGQVVTVAGGLVLASWWLRHVRMRRRNRPQVGEAEGDTP